MENFDEKFKTFFEGVQKIYSDYMVQTFPNNPRDEFSYKVGKRYTKVICGGSAFCFVDNTNGDVLKAAGWSAPAKGARGNIFDENNGLGRMSAYGPEYNKRGRR